MSSYTINHKYRSRYASTKTAEEVKYCNSFGRFFDYFAWLPSKNVRIGIIEALSDTHFCILSRDCFNLSREYFSLWVIKNVTG